MSKKKKSSGLYHRRLFLNPKTGFAAIEVAINEKSQTYVSALVEISDCNRKIALDFHTYKGNRKERLAKLDLLIKELSDFRAVYAADTEHLK